MSHAPEGRPSELLGPGLMRSSAKANLNHHLQPSESGSWMESVKSCVHILDPDAKLPQTCPEGQIRSTTDHFNRSTSNLPKEGSRQVIFLAREH